MAAAKRPATPHTIPVASSGRSRRSRVMGTRMSSLDPSRTLDSSSSGLAGEIGSWEKRGSNLFSKRRDAAGSVAVSVNERKRGLSTIKAVVSAGRRIEVEVERLLP